MKGAGVYKVKLHRPSAVFPSIPVLGSSSGGLYLTAEAGRGYGTLPLTFTSRCLARADEVRAWGVGAWVRVWPVRGFFLASLSGPSLRTTLVSELRILADYFRT